MSFDKWLEDRERPSDPVLLRFRGETWELPPEMPSVAGRFITVQNRPLLYLAVEALFARTVKRTLPPVAPKRKGDEVEVDQLAELFRMVPVEDDLVYLVAHEVPEAYYTSAGNSSASSDA